MIALDIDRPPEAAFFCWGGGGGGATVESTVVCRAQRGEICVAGVHICWRGRSHQMWCQQWCPEPPNVGTYVECGLGDLSHQMWSWCPEPPNVGTYVECGFWDLSHQMLETTVATFLDILTKSLCTCISVTMLDAAARSKGTQWLRQRCSGCTLES